MSLAPQSFSNITPAQFAAIAADVKTTVGVSLDGNTGTQSADGYTVEWAYDGESNLVIDVLKKPFLIPESIVESHITQLVENARAA